MVESPSLASASGNDSTLQSCTSTALEVAVDGPVRILGAGGEAAWVPPLVRAERLGWVVKSIGGGGRVAWLIGVGRVA